ncbi:MAG: copper chaperone [Rhodothermales bacterium]|jgi:copper chaperone
MKHELIIEGMSCNHCVRGVKEVLGAIEAVTVDEVEIGRASIQADDTGLAKARAAIEEDGYTVVETRS